MDNKNYDLTMIVEYEDKESEECLVEVPNDLSIEGVKSTMEQMLASKRGLYCSIVDIEEIKTK